MNNLLIKKESFTSNADRRMHALAKLKSVHLSEDQYHTLIFEFAIKKNYGYKIPEIDSLYICRLGSLNSEPSKMPLSFKWLLESTSFLKEDENGRVDLTQLIDKEYIITVQKKIASNYVFFNLINIISYNKAEENQEEEHQ